MLRQTPSPPPGRVLAAAAPFERGLAASAALLVLLSLFWTWNYVSDQPVSAWDNYARTDWLVAAAAVVAIVGAAAPARRAGRLLELAGAGFVIAFVGRVALAGDFVRGPALALLGALLVVLAVLAESAPGPTRRVVGVVAPATGAVAARLRRLGVAAPATLDRREWRRFAVSAWRVVTFSPFVGTLAWWLATPNPPFWPGGGTDGSWVTALNLANRAGLDFGTEIVWTYGPLGHLTVPRIIDPQQVSLALPGYAYVAIVSWALATTAVAVARRSMPVILAFAAAVILLETFRATARDEQTQLAVAAVAFGWAILALRSERLQRSRWWPPLLATLGAFAAVAVLVKLNVGLSVVLMLGVTALATTREWRRPVAPLAFGAGFAITLVVVWLALGQSLAALDDYARTSYEVIAGFADSLQDGHAETWTYMAAWLVAAAVAALAWSATRAWPPVCRAGAFLVTAIVLFSAFKQGFVRHDGRAFFATGAFVALALGSPDARPRWTSWAVSGFCVVCFLAIAKPLLYEFHAPGRSADFRREAIETFRDPDAKFAQALAQTREGEAMPARAIELIGDRTVHIFPQEAAAAWAHPTLNWRPLPVFQDYQAYTPALTRRNAEMLRSERAPERILRQAVDSGFGDPAGTIELMCRYVHVFGEGDWHVLARVPDRCGAPRVVARERVRTEEAVRVPAVGPDELLLVRVEGMEKSFWESIRGFLWKPYMRRVSLDPGDSARVSPTQAAMPALLKAGADADYPQPYRLGKPATELTYSIYTQEVIRPLRLVDRPLTVEFLSVPVSRAGVG